MGNDGGVVAVKRRFMVRQKARTTAAKSSAAKWKLCAMTGKPLTGNIMCDELGQLMDAEAALEYLSKKTPRPGFEHVRRRSHLLKLQRPPPPAPAEGAGAAAASSGPSRGEGLQCPVSGVAAGDAHPFLAVKHCGHYVAEDLLRRIPQASCWVCGRPVQAKNSGVPADILERATAAARAAAAVAGTEAHEAASAVLPATDWVGSDVIILNPSEAQAAAAKVVLRWQRQKHRSGRPADRSGAAMARVKRGREEDAGVAAEKRPKPADTTADTELAQMGAT